MPGTKQRNRQTSASRPSKSSATGKTKSPVSNEAKLDAKNPIPFEYGGTSFTFLNDREYLPFLPPLDTYGQLLLEARLLSTTHNACITTKKDYCAGAGLADINGKEIPAGSSLATWLASMNLHNQSAKKLNRKIFEEFFTFGNVPIELVRFEVMGKKRFFIYVHNFLEWRLGKPNSDDVVEYAIQSKLFLRNGNNGIIGKDALKEAKVLPIYNPQRTEKENWVKVNGAERTLIWYKNPVSGFPYYGLPSSVASMIYQLLEYKGARFELDNFENNLVLGGILALKGNLSQSEANRIGKDVINTHTGDGKRGRIMVTASEEGIEGSDFHQFDTAKEGSYQQADEKWTQKIILAHQWDAVLAGIVAPSTMGKGAGFITKIMELKQNTVIKPAQDDMVDEVWANILPLAAAWDPELGIADYELGIQGIIDISGLTDIDITPAVQVNEVRKAKGLTEDEAMNGVYMKPTAPAQPKTEGGDDV